MTRTSTDTPQLPGADTPATQVVAAQPAAKETMTIAGAADARNTKGVAADNNGEREWSTGMCGCCSVPGKCLAAFCCPCILYGKIVTRLDSLEERGTPHKDGGEMCGADAGIFCVLQYPLHIGWLIGTGTRASVRRRYKVKGNMFTDCLASAFCLPCTLVQESREIELEEEELRRRIGTAVEK